MNSLSVNRVFYVPPSLIFPAPGESSLHSITFQTVESGTISLKTATHIKSHSKVTAMLPVHTQTESEKTNIKTDAQDIGTVDQSR